MSVADGEPAAGPPAVGSSMLLEAEREAGTTPKRRRAPKRRQAGRRAAMPGERRWFAAFFLAPALFMLAAILLYPLIYSVIRSLFSDTPTGAIKSFTGLSNYGNIFTDDRSLQAVKNNIWWIIFVPTIITILGLIFAVLTERIRWATVFKTVLFMPMAISALASGITFSLIYADQPSRGLANAVAVGVHDTFSPTSPYPGVQPRDTKVFGGSAKTGYTTHNSFSPGTPVLLPVVGLNLTQPPSTTAPAQAPTTGKGVYGVVWNDFRLGGGGTLDQVDSGERGLGGATVEAVRNGKVVATTQAAPNGQFSFPSLTSGSYELELPASDFAAPYNGISWLGPSLITPAIMAVYLWIYTGFAMVLIAAGMAAIPRDALEAARVDGATEWQVFRRITAPLLAPVLMVVFVTLAINVLKVFDVVYVMQQVAGGSAGKADVLAVTLFRDYGNQQYGLASAIGILLVLLVIPAMILNIRRFRRENQ
jgi:alpha-glucoside transport system permease protein